MTPLSRGLVFHGRGTHKRLECPPPLYPRDRPTTTYRKAFDELLAIDPSVMPRPDDRFVDDGDVITAAGVSAGIDMALHLVGRLGSLDAARATRRGIRYDPRQPV